MEEIRRENDGTTKEKKRSLEDLNVIDDFLMNAAASDREGGEEFCRLILSTLLNRDIGKVRVNPQKFIPASTPNQRGIRMDVEVIETTAEVLNVYDIEPCRYHKKGLEKSNRFYQAKIDSRYLESGERDFTEAAKSLCDNDPALRSIREGLYDVSVSESMSGSAGA